VRRSLASLSSVVVVVAAFVLFCWRLALTIPFARFTVAQPPSNRRFEKPIGLGPTNGTPTQGQQNGAGQ